MKVPELYEGSNVAAMAEVLEPYFRAPRVPKDATVSVGMVAEAAYVDAPPRVVFVGPGGPEVHRAPMQQREDGRVVYEALELYDAHLWGRDLREAQALRDALLVALFESFSPKWGVELKPATNTGGNKVSGQGWAIVVPLVLVVPVFSERYITRRVTTATVDGQVVSTLGDPPDPAPEEVPGHPYTE